MKAQLPLVFYKTSILWVDDDKLLLQIAADQYSKSYFIKTFDNPNDCVYYLQKYESLFCKQTFLRGYKEHDDYDAINHMPVDVNIQGLANLRTNPNRYNEISVMVIDYRMPELSGIELCQHFSSLPIKKILLTGEADHTQAINAFNDGIIHRFIRKDNPMLNEELELHLHALTKQYFREQTAALLSHLEADKKSPLTDPVFIDFFNKWCSNYRICEYYLIDKNGSFLTVNEEKEINYFIVHTDLTLDAFVNTNEDDDSVHSCIDLVSKRKKIPFFGVDKEAWQVEPSKWAEFFYLPKIINGKEKYYWSVVTERLFNQ